MPASNDTLPDNLKELVGYLSTEQAMPLGTMSGIPFLALRIAAGDEALLRDNAIVCELKPSILNIDHDNETIAVCFVQIRLNNSDEHIYTAVYDLRNDKQYGDCHALLNMRQYGLFIATDTLHDFQVFDTEFDAPFDPRDVIAEARNQSTASDPGTFYAVVQALCGHTDKAELWRQFHAIAPADKQWYGRMQMRLQHPES